MHEFGNHGTLCDELGQPKAYRVLDAHLPSVPLSESQLWPEDMLMVNAFRDGHTVKVPCGPGVRCDADFYAEQVEAIARRRIGLHPCGGDHGALLGRRCVQCGAAR